MLFAWTIIEFKTPLKNSQEKTKMIRRNRHCFRGLLLGHDVFNKDYHARKYFLTNFRYQASYFIFLVAGSNSRCLRKSTYVANNA